jgi:hypothetical protein
MQLQSSNFLNDDVSIWRQRRTKRYFTGRYTLSLPITMSARSKASNVFARLNSGFVGSNPAQYMDDYVRLFCVYVVLCVGSDLATGWSLIQRVLRKWNKTKRYKDVQSSKWE